MIGGCGEAGAIGQGKRAAAASTGAGENPYAGRRKQNVTSLDKHKARRLEG